MNGIIEDELDVILSRVFARHLTPFELRLAIWKLLDLGKCLRCKLLYQNTSMHGCEIYGYSSCPRCTTSHFCLSLKDDMVFPTPEGIFVNIIQPLIGATLSPGTQCTIDSSSHHCAIFGFDKAEIEPIRRALNVLRMSSTSVMLMFQNPPLLLSFNEMDIEFVEGLLGSF
jgi:hypothetical protein